MILKVKRNGTHPHLQRQIQEFNSMKLKSDLLKIMQKYENLAVHHFSIFMSKPYLYGFSQNIIHRN